MLENLGFAALALAPILFILLYVYLKDKYDREPLSYLILTFVLGALAAYPVVKIGAWMNSYTIFTDKGSPIELFFYILCVIAIVEEGMKYLVWRLFLYPREVFSEPFDGIVYSIAAAMGFAAIENLVYVSEGGFQSGIVRMFTAVPTHAACGAFVGYFAGWAKFDLDKKHATMLHLKGLGLAILFHTLYDYFIFLDWGVSGLLSLVILGFGIYFSIRAVRIREHQANQLLISQKAHLIQIEQEDEVAKE